MIRFNKHLVEKTQMEIGVTNHEVKMLVIYSIVELVLLQ